MTITNPADYWDPLWASGRRYRGLDPEEQQLTRHFLGAGRSRPALDIGCGDGALAWYLHADLGYRTTAIDCSSAALKIAQAEQSANDGPVFQQLDIETDDTNVLPDVGYALVTCRLVFAFIKDKPALLDRIRSLLPPGGTFWLVTPLAERLPEERKSIGITAQQEELLTAPWSSVQSEDLDSMRCYALRP
ncbi:class I SAM-dependent methyltransferase [Streptomyces europaeiscabiei]|uniref:class I SAM-dependent methyltransferase n=1 Tax=Streptomyces europaeiscabiei TaxID=146819 RepID=UPI0029A9D1A6|nr:class I SAM-dependent methyltransferase [Streptomyces europaeiscabiei]MDX3784101.1 class I SAM-dependent methyltransferase [Streptomyces europaeiscabiei]